MSLTEQKKKKNKLKRKEGVADVRARTRAIPTISTNKNEQIIK